MTTLSAQIDDRYDRQVRAFGPDTQRHLATLTIAVVGLGGVGSMIAQSLAHLGATRLILIDPDTVSTSNLNRLVGATAEDAANQTTKATVAARTVQTINPQMHVTALAASVLQPNVWSTLRSADILIGAVDGHAPRWALNRLAVQYARCYLDGGAEIRPAAENPNRTLEAGGHVAVVRPNGPCLLCMAGYDPRLAGIELDPDLATARRAAGYRTEDPTAPTPSVVFLNQILAGNLVGELVNWISPWRPPNHYILLDAVAGTTTALHAERDHDCPACGPGSPRGLGDAAGPPDLPDATRLPAQLPPHPEPSPQQPQPVPNPCGACHAYTARRLPPAITSGPTAH